MACKNKIIQIFTVLFIIGTVVTFICGLIIQYDKPGRDTFIGLSVGILTVAPTVLIGFPMLLRARQQDTNSKGSSNFLSLANVGRITCALILLTDSILWAKPYGSSPQWLQPTCSKQTLNATSCLLTASLDVSTYCHSPNGNLISLANAYHDRIDLNFSDNDLEEFVPDVSDLSFTRCTFKCGASAIYPQVKCGKLVVRVSTSTNILGFSRSEEPFSPYLIGAFFFVPLFICCLLLCVVVAKAPLSAQREAGVNV